MCRILCCTGFRHEALPVSQLAARVPAVWNPGSQSLARGPRVGELVQVRVPGIAELTEGAVRSIDHTATDRYKYKVELRSMPGKQQCFKLKDLAPFDYVDAPASWNEGWYTACPML